MPMYPVSTVVITPPTVEPVSLGEAKAQLRILPDFADDDTMIQALVATGRRLVEQRLGIALMATQYRSMWADTLDIISNRPDENWWGWSDTLELPHPPLLVDASHSVVVTAGGVTIAPSSYTIDSDSRPSRIRLANPGSGSQLVVTFWAGAATPAAIQPTIKAAILLLVGHLWANREAVSTTGMNAVVLPFGVEMLLASEAITGAY